jgi:hypothetical protein
MRRDTLQREIATFEPSRTIGRFLTVFALDARFAVGAATIYGGFALVFVELIIRTGFVRTRLEVGGTIHRSK